MITVKQQRADQQAAHRAGTAVYGITQAPETDRHAASAMEAFSVTRPVVISLLITLALFSSRPLTAAESNAASSNTDRVHGLDAVAYVGGADSNTATARQQIADDSVNTLADMQQSLVKLSHTGEILADTEANWECVEDRGSKLTWEVKKDDGGMRDKDHSYSWLHSSNGISTGASNGGRCKGGIKCDTSSYIRALNAQKLCGYTDWRLPTREELETLVEYSKDTQQATINTGFFPETVPSWYWTASEHAKREHYAWYVLFRNGVALNDLKERPKHIRLVRGSRTQ